MTYPYLFRGMNLQGEELIEAARQCVAEILRDLQPQLMKRCNCGPARWFDRVGNSDNSCNSTVNGCIESCAPTGRQPDLLVHQRIGRNTFALHQPVSADEHPLTVHNSGNTMTGDGVELTDCEPLHALLARCPYDGLGNRMFRASLNRGNARQNERAFKTVRQDEAVTPPASDSGENYVKNYVKKLC